MVPQPQAWQGTARRCRAQQGVAGHSMVLTPGAKMPSHASKAPQMLRTPACLAITAPGKEPHAKPVSVHASQTRGAGAQLYSSVAHEPWSSLAVTRAPRRRFQGLIYLMFKRLLSSVKGALDLVAAVEALRCWEAPPHSADGGQPAHARSMTLMQGGVSS